MTEIDFAKLIKVASDLVFCATCQHGTQQLTDHRRYFCKIKKECVWQQVGCSDYTDIVKSDIDSVFDEEDE